ncbi:MAG TPA: carotenoid biosynthesis protein [bacterium]|nr:carotenoid biosynthesis protein [bacterium]
MFDSIAEFAQKQGVWSLFTVVGTGLCIFLGFGFVVSQVEPAQPFVSGVGMLILAAPAVVGLFQAYRWRGVLAYFGLACLGLAIETAAIKTGIPYGSFAYHGALGYRLFGVVPWTLTLAWPPLVLTAVIAARRLHRSWLGTGVIAVLLLVAMDAILDPGAVALGFWTWTHGGIYYAVPLSNYLGWCLSGSLGVYVVQKWLPGLDTRLVAISGVFSVAFWSGIVLGFSFVLPSLIGFILLSYFGWAFLRRV